ncbi:MAG: sigma factor [Solirubrobacterales bacterium]
MWHRRAPVLRDLRQPSDGRRSRCTTQTRWRSVDRLAGELFTTRRAQLLRVARRNAACGADAEEALQEAFAAFLETYDPAGGAPPLAWLTVVTKRACWRAKGRRAVSVEPLAVAEVSRVARGRVRLRGDRRALRLDADEGEPLSI